MKIKIEKNSKRMTEEKVINDLVYFNNLKIVQNKKYFNFSLDSILLPNFCIVNKSTKRILDLCTGNAPIPLVLSTMCDGEIVGVEIQKNIYDLAIESVKINKSTNTALVFLVNFVLLFINFITGSIKSEIMTPIKNGIYFSYKYIHGISINNTAKNKIMNDLSPLPNFSIL